MESSAYWQDRAEKNALHVFCYSQNRAQMVTRWFGRAQREMGQKIADFYKQYAEQEHITLRQAKATITDRRTLTLTMEEAHRLAQQSQDEELQRLLRKSYLGRAISREEFLLMQLNLLATELYGGYTDLTHKSLTELFEESYYRSIFDTQQFIGFGSGFNRISTHQIEAAVTTAWQGKNYSQRIWGDHRTSLARRLNRIVTTGFIEGCSSSEMVVELQKAMSAEAYAARRLIRTECCAVSNRASLLGYQENGTEQYQILATLDYKTSELCRSMDGKIFDSKDAKPGTNLPPFHPFCRSTTVPYWQHDEFDADETRVARNAKGEVYKVPANLTYTQWHKQHVESDPAEQLAEQKLKNGRSDAAQYKQYRQLLGKDAPKSFDDFQNIRYTDPISKSFLELDYRRRSWLQSEPELTLPCAETATADDAKFLKYLFDGTNAEGLAKGVAITSRLGYDKNNWQSFRKELLRKAPLYPVRAGRLDQFGQRYEQKIVVNGLKGTLANLIVAWTHQDEKTWMSSAYIKEVN